MLLEQIYEQDFLRLLATAFARAAAAIKRCTTLRQGCSTRIHYVIDCDISSFFDNLQHDELLAILRKRVNDGRLLELIEMWLKAGIMDGKELVFPGEGKPPGIGDFAAVGERVPARSAGHVVRRSGDGPLSRQGGDVPLCGRLRHRLRAGRQTPSGS